MTFAPKRLTEWLADVDAATKPRWLIEDFLPEDSLTMISGHPKGLGRKSLLAMVQTLTLAAGATSGFFQPSRQVPVLYCYQEGPPQSTAKRFRMLARGLGIDLSKLKDFWLLHRIPLDLRTKSQVELIGQWSRANKVGVVVFDTLAKVMQGDEDSAENMGRVVRGIEQARSYGVSVLTLHHLSKQQPAYQAGNCDPDRDMRGSSAIAGAYETHQAVRHYGFSRITADLLVSNKDGGAFAHKHRWEFIDEQTHPGLDVAEHRALLHMGPRTSWESLSVPTDEEITETLSCLSADSCYTVDMLAAAWKVPKGVAFEMVAQLIALEQLESAKYGYRVKP